MPLLRIQGFDGEIPRTSATMLADNQAQVADNVKLYSKELRYWRGPEVESYEPPSDTATLYKYYHDTSDSYEWLTWSTDVDVVRSPVADTTYFRLYYTGDGAPKKTYNSAAISGSGPYPASSYNMGVPAPTGAPTISRASASRNVTLTIADPCVVTLADHGIKNGEAIQFLTTGALPTGLAVGTTYYVKNITTDTFEVAATVDGASIATSGSQSGTHSVFSAENAESRVYVYTYISTFAGITEESAPSPASEILTVYFGDTVTVNSFSTAPTSGYNITGIRIYRSVTGETTDNYLLVDEIAIATSSYADSKTASQLGEAVGTIGWTPPPSDLAGLTSHPSGSLVGFSGNTVYFSEPFFPHAWPLAYAISVPDEIVGLGVFGTSVVVATDRNPYVITGSFPGTMSSEQVPIVEPCVSKRSIRSDEFGTVYASPNGLVGIGPGMRGVITSNLFAYNEWTEYQPSLIAGAVTNNQYFAIYPSNSNNFKTMVINRSDVPALSFIDMQATCVHVDSKSSFVYYIDAADRLIKRWDADDLNPIAFTWKSRRFTLPVGTTFSALKLDADYGAIADAQTYNETVAQIEARNAAKFSGNLLGTLNSAELNYSYNDTSIVYGNTYHGIELNGSTLENIPLPAALRSVQIVFCADGERVDPSMTITSFDPIRIPPFKCRTLEVEIVGTVNVRSLSLATTVAELHQ